MFDYGGPLRIATSAIDRRVERIAAELVHNGVPAWPAIEQARKIYQQRKSQEELKRILDRNQAPDTLER